VGIEMEVSIEMGTRGDLRAWEYLQLPAACRDVEPNHSRNYEITLILLTLLVTVLFSSLIHAL
jgi:hypothetical protein